MSYDVRTDGSASSGTAMDHLEELLGIYDESASERWPQLARGYGENDFTTVRASVAGEWQAIDHEDLHVDPEDCLRLCEE
ncbi:hypothetical protein [Haloarchaeobius amylolyticus]|uniref:hypothetical protein n=1 Tax=Haloarchaeobius amylolyticus TaxID=1198296 RepID=UPI00226FFC40|nr:hypothetical protein [Haloarchaeobius amylolyticus]